MMNNTFETVKRNLNAISKYGLYSHLDYIMHKKANIELIHRRENNSANHALYSIEVQKGKLSTNNKRKAIEYAIEVLGSKKYAPWLLFYTAYKNEFMEGWIPFNYYLIEVLPVMNGGYKFLSAYKTLTNRILNTLYIPDIGYFIHGNFYDSNYKLIDYDAVKNYLFRESKLVFFKENSRSRGKGVTIFDNEDFDVSSMNGFLDGCFQSQIHQHEFFTEICGSSATSTIRITTVKDQHGKVSVKFAYLRVGRTTERWVKSSTNVRIPISIDKGCLLEFGFMKDWKIITKHPDTSYVFSDAKIPLFDDMTKICCQLHESFPLFSVIGWDLCIDNNDKIKIMEWNTSQNHITLPEAATGPCFVGLGWESLWKQPLDR